VSLNGRRLEHRRPPPELGEHSLDLLGDLGYDSDSIASLVDAGVVRGAGE
jgi:crotonobetainyl-CoA:carnitine CoA-transferase CaiB-like acyl-CoA transferase